MDERSEPKAVKLEISGEAPHPASPPRGEGDASTISKVQFFRRAIELALSGKLHAAGHSILNKVDKLLESRLARLMALTGTVVGLGAWVVRAVVLVVFSPANSIDSSAHPECAHRTIQTFAR